LWANYRDLNLLTNELAGSSVEKCVAYCLSQGFLYAGLQNGQVNLLKKK
jgi:hypothetical protein